MSGSGAMSWWWGAYIAASPSYHRTSPEFPANERINPPIRDFFAGEDLAGMSLLRSIDHGAVGSVVALGLDNGPSKGFAWIRDAENEYGTGSRPGDLAGRTMHGVTVAFDLGDTRPYDVEVHDPWGVVPTSDQVVYPSGGTLTVTLPDFTRDVAIKFTALDSATAAHAGHRVRLQPRRAGDDRRVGPRHPARRFRVHLSRASAHGRRPAGLHDLADLLHVQRRCIRPGRRRSRPHGGHRHGVLRRRPGPAVHALVLGIPTRRRIPCVSTRYPLGSGEDDGDVQLSIVGSHAGTWTFGTVPPRVPVPTTVVGNGDNLNQNSPRTFEFVAVLDAQGVADGTITRTESGITLAGPVTCLYVDGHDIIVGGRDDATSGGPTWFTLYLTDGGSVSYQDDVVFGGPSQSTPADCSPAGDFGGHQPFAGQVTVLDGPSLVGLVHGDGTYHIGNGVMRTVAIDATRLADGSVSGTYAVEDPSTSRAGTVDCLDIRPDRTMIIGHGPDPAHPTGPDVYTSIFIRDDAPDNAGEDTIWLNADRSTLPFDCLAAPAMTEQTLMTGEMQVETGVAPDPTIVRAAVLSGGSLISRPVADAAHPLIAAVASPATALVAIQEGSATGPAPAGSAYLDPQLDITAPSASAAMPLTIALTVDQDTLTSTTPDLTAQDLAAFLDGVRIKACTLDGSDDPARPRSCVSARQTLHGGFDEGDARLVIKTSHSGRFNVGSGPAAAAPGAPHGVSATPGNHQALVTWSPPADDGGNILTTYTVTASPGGRTVTVSAAQTVAAVDGLLNGVTYTFRVHATNDIGTGPDSSDSNGISPISTYRDLTHISTGMPDGQYADLRRHDPRRLAYLLPPVRQPERHPGPVRVDSERHQGHLDRSKWPGPHRRLRRRLSGRVAGALPDDQLARSGRHRRRRGCLRSRRDDDDPGLDRPD